MKKRKKAKLIIKSFLVFTFLVYPFVIILVTVASLFSVKLPNVDQSELVRYKRLADLIDADWQLIAAYDLAIHKNQVTQLDPEAAAWFFLRVEYDGMNLSGKERLLDYLGEEDFSFEEALNHIMQINSTYGKELYKISARSIVSLETILDKETYKWVEILVSNNLIAKMSGEVNYSGSNYGNLVLENKGFFAIPLPAGSYTVSSRGFGYRIHPVFHTRKFHSGQDFPAPAGTPVGAAADGWVKVGWDPEGYGNFVKVTHANGFISVYAHLLSVSVKNGDTVKKGDCIGLVGSTGTSTGNHLHFEVRKDGQYLDPMKFLR